MNRRILIQVTAPAVVIGLLLLGTCLASAWYISRLQTNLNRILSQNVKSQEAAQQLEIRVRQLRFHSFRYLIETEPVRRDAMAHQITNDHNQIEKALQQARDSVHTPAEDACVQKIEEGFQKYHREMDQLEAEIAALGPAVNISKVMDAHPIQNVVDPCQELLRVNKEMIDHTALESERVVSQARLLMLFLGVGGPLGGLVIGYGMARGLSRSIYQLSVRVQDMAHRLDQDVASVSVAAEGDIQILDKQLEHVVNRVKEVAERIQRHQREMLRAEQLSAVGQLAASVAHEVRNPLTSVKMLVDSVLRSQNRKPLTLDDLQVIHGEIVRLEHTVQGLLDFARPPAPQRSTGDLRQVVTQGIELIRARARQQRVAIEVQGDDQPMPVNADSGQLCTVLVNLFLNSLDAMPQGGFLQIGLDTTGPEEIQLTIRDTGTGIAEEMAGRLFIPFASSKPTGTGLGLSISRRIVEEHGGHISAANHPEGGACFTITLPTTAEEASHAHAASH
jgi:two-component system sensor histidine kinase HydH